jgi:hypothetical protein
MPGSVARMLGNLNASEVGSERAESASGVMHGQHIYLTLFEIARELLADLRSRGIAVIVLAKKVHVAVPFAPHDFSHGKPSGYR